MSDQLKSLLKKLDGIRSCGFAELIDSGLPVKDWFVIPECSFKPAKIIEVSKSDETELYLKEIGKYKKGSDYPKIGRDFPIDITCAYDGNLLKFTDGGTLRAQIVPYSNEEHEKIISAILDHNKAMDADRRMFKSLINYICIINGWIQLSPKDEAIIIPDVKENSKELANFYVFAEEHAFECVGLCIAGAISHWLTNHTIGQMSQSNIVSKTWGFTSLKAVFNEKGANLNKLLYDNVHQVSKRNMLFALDKSIPCLTAVYTYGLPLAKEIEPDKSFGLRMSGLPSGSRKIEIALALLREIDRNGMAICSGCHKNADKICELYIRAKQIGVRAHAGSQFYTRYTKDYGPQIDFCDNDVIDMIRSYGTIISTIDPDSTLSNSPIIKAVLASGRDTQSELNCKAMAKALAIQSEKIFKDAVENDIAARPKDSVEVHARIQSAIKEVDKVIKADEDRIKKAMAIKYKTSGQAEESKDPLQKEVIEDPKDKQEG